MSKVTIIILSIAFGIATFIGGMKNITTIIFGPMLDWLGIMIFLPFVFIPVFLMIFLIYTVFWYFVLVFVNRLILRVLHK